MRTNSPADSPLPSVCLRTVNICRADNAGKRRTISIDRDGMHL